MTEHAHTLRVAVYGIFLQDNKVLMLRRFDTGWMDGKYGLPAGHLEKNENLYDAVIREIHEETGVKVAPENLEFKHVSHRHEEGNLEYIDFYYLVTEWEGDPRITEPDKSDDLQWFSLNDLPEKIVPNAKMGILACQGSQIISEFK